MTLGSLCSEGMVSAPYSVKIIGRPFRTCAQPFISLRKAASASTMPMPPMTYQP